MRIVDVRSTPLFIPYKKPFNWAQGEITGASVVLVELTTDVGLIGYGECVGTPTASGIQAFIAEASRIFVGRTPFESASLVTEAYRVLFQSQGTCSAPRFARQIMAGLEMACWDLAGKATDRPVHQLLGGAVNDTISYFGFPQGNTPSEIATEARSMAKDGFEVIYVKVGRGDDVDIQIVAETRKAIGASKRLRIDPNESWSGLRGTRMIGRIAEYDVEFVEQPTNAEIMSALDSLQRKAQIAIAADQTVFTPYDVFDVCRSRIADLIVLGLHETGGIHELIKAAHVAEAAGIEVCIHGLYETGITTCASHQAALTISNLDDGNQYMNHLLQWDIVKSPSLKLSSGRLDPISSPGLGFELDMDAAARAADLHSQLGLP